MAYNAPVLSLALPAAVTNGIAQSQSGTAHVALTLNGSLVTAGVANLVTAQRVVVTSAGDDSAHTFSIVGTDRYGRAQSETFSGNTASPAVAVSAKDYLTVTSFTPNQNTTSTIIVGTGAYGSTAPYVCDTFINPANYGIGIKVTGTVAYLIEGSYDDLTPSWDLANNSPVWYTDVDGSAGATQNQTITGPFTMVRLTITSGTGTVTARLIVPFIAGA